MIEYQKEVEKMNKEPKNIELSEDWQNLITAMSKSHSEYLKKIASSVLSFKYDRCLNGVYRQTYLKDSEGQLDEITGITIVTKGKLKKIAIFVDGMKKAFVIIDGKKGSFLDKSKKAVEFNYNKRIVLKDQAKENTKN